MKIKVDEEDTEDTKIYLYAAMWHDDRTCENFKDRAIASEFVKIKWKLIWASIRKENTMRPIGGRISKAIEWLLTQRQLNEN
jgi:hypothetical protein